MNDYLLAALLGIVEGVTEFLPVSSTAHLRIAQHFLGISLEDEFWKLFAVFIQLGAILAVVVLYREKLLGFLREALSPSFRSQGWRAALRHPIGLISIAFLCTAVPAFLLSKIIGDNLESLSLMAASLFVGGVVMIVVDLLWGKKGKTAAVEAMLPWQAIAIGLIQVLSAVFPGTSRSMSTIAGGQIVGLSRSAALDFSFLVSIPVMIVACAYDLLKFLKEAGEVGIVMTSSQVITLTIGFVVSFFVAYIVVAWFLSYVKNRGFTPFGLYRIALGLGLWVALLYP